MRKNQTLFIAGILLLAGDGRGPGPGGVRSLQQPGDTPGPAAPGRMAGDVVLFLRTGNARWRSRHSEFSAPLAEGLAVDQDDGVSATPVLATAAVDVDEGTVTITMPQGSVKDQ